MGVRALLLAVAWCCVAAACTASGPDATRGDAAAAPVDLLTPPGARTLDVTFATGTLPDWCIREGRGEPEVARRLRVSKGHPVRLLLRADRACVVRIPAV